MTGTTARPSTDNEAEQVAAVRALTARPEVRTVRLALTGEHLLIELVGAERDAVVEALVPAGPDGIRPDRCEARDITTWAVYDSTPRTHGATPADASRGADRRGSYELIGYVMKWHAGPAEARYWADYVSPTHEEICHAEHAPTLVRAVAAIVRSRANEGWTADRRAEAENRRWTETLTY